MHRRRLTERALARLIASVGAGPQAGHHRRRAVELSARLNAERGTAVAVDALQTLTEGALARP